ncbi:hypothetical protein ccbrp13_52900 [Ktedonobacteria bacterium brp13]|nr:hypothetical protein ccbrp13_52900 [Ktedonobacteria bacterium brp13]
MSTPPDSFSMEENNDTPRPEEAYQPPLDEESTAPNASPTQPTQRENTESAESTSPTDTPAKHTQEETATSSTIPDDPLAALPPEAQGEVNGGPLGCCLGVVIGLLLSVSIALLSRFYADPLYKALNSNLSILVRILMVLVAIIAMIALGYLGWRIGKLLYREYEQPIPQPRQRRRRKKS